MKGISRSRQGTRQEKVVRGEHDQIIHVRKKKKMKLVYANKNPYRYMHPTETGKWPVSPHQAELLQ